MLGVKAVPYNISLLDIDYVAVKVGAGIFLYLLINSIFAFVGFIALKSYTHDAVEIHCPPPRPPLLACFMVPLGLWM